jgi:hypothetical protein
LRLRRAAGLRCTRVAPRRCIATRRRCTANAAAAVRVCTVQARARARAGRVGLLWHRAAAASGHVPGDQRRRPGRVPQHDRPVLLQPGRRQSANVHREGVHGGQRAGGRSPLLHRPRAVLRVPVGPLRVEEYNVLSACGSRPRASCTITALCARTLDTEAAAPNTFCAATSSCTLCVVHARSPASALRPQQLRGAAARARTRASLEHERLQKKQSSHIPLSAPRPDTRDCSLQASRAGAATRSCDGQTRWCLKPIRVRQQRRLHAVAGARIASHHAQIVRAPVRDARGWHHRSHAALHATTQATRANCARGKPQPPGASCVLVS